MESSNQNRVCSVPEAPGEVSSGAGEPGRTGESNGPTSLQVKGDAHELEAKLRLGQCGPIPEMQNQNHHVLKITDDDGGGGGGGGSSSISGGVSTRRLRSREPENSRTEGSRSLGSWGMGRDPKIPRLDPQPKEPHPISSPIPSQLGSLGRVVSIVRSSAAAGAKGQGAGATVKTERPDWSQLLLYRESCWSQAATKLREPDGKESRDLKKEGVEKVASSNRRWASEHRKEDRSGLQVGEEEEELSDSSDSSEEGSDETAANESGLEQGKPFPQGLECVEPSQDGIYLLIDDRGIPYTITKEEIEARQSRSRQDPPREPSPSTKPAPPPLAPEKPPIPRKSHYCPVCSRTFLYLSDLERHRITHSEHKPHECKVCGKSFKRSSHLERHKHIHTGERPFICVICQKGFREPGELMRHQRVHTGEKPYQCELCHMRFTERNTLRRHIKRKHVLEALRQPGEEEADWCDPTDEAAAVPAAPAPEDDND
ncbi:zinc finger and BTB domain-containing protein 17 [Latimeria chalumnae]|uniref:zinc finger and BTB domain-containing protein 17 n=1 Tax=Latimeria chalumnae TaxID=7897 RepID=UPI0006D8EB8B|nr:PREDICTED: zinc finger protein 524 [Latimeria chalumnae]|eukprot:XP_014349441.1 PREDICTED: zinc finger protein 524 [Latimeria chalumnae]